MECEAMAQAAIKVSENVAAMVFFVGFFWVVGKLISGMGE